MVDFRDRVGTRAAAKVIDPIKLYNSLDRASDKGPLRPAQERILREWQANRRGDRDVILKLHTGQGKTLLGLLMLQSKLNEGAGPALYLCPNHFLVNQTVEQAMQFGVRCVTATDSLPDDFTECRAILVTVVHKLFNGLTKFGIDARSLPVGSVLVDDAHACIDAIKDQFVITLRREKPNESTARDEIVALFESDLRSQGDGSFEDILGNNPHAYLPVPYWAWWDKTGEVARILSRHAGTEAVRFVWPLLKDSLRHTLCLVSGTRVVITPHLVSLDQFGSYSGASHRIFMSATVTDDSFLVKGLGLSRDTVQRPLVDPEERWSGEKMVLLPSAIDSALSRSAIVEEFAKPNAARTFGVVALVPSGQRCADWATYGARIVDKDSIDRAVADLRNRGYSRAVVIANYYDGIDLPDNTCRILIIDSRPFAEDLLERYVEDRRRGSKLVFGRIARSVEQGMGRAVRGEKDYCVIILTGPDLMRALQAPGQREFFSDQTRKQIEIGREITELAKEEIESGAKPAAAAFDGLIKQCLQRDAGWKAWYAEQMNSMESHGRPTRADLLGIFGAEVEAERLFQNGRHDRAVEAIQGLLDARDFPEAERGWYLQEIARYRYPASVAQADEDQRHAHSMNRNLLRPKDGMVFSKVSTLTPERRTERIRAWLADQDNFESVAAQVEAILTNLSFGISADRFEQALKELASVLGFESDRPDKEWKEGPDNLWGLRDNQYLLFECKSEVELTRAEVNKRESDQMNRSSAWFNRRYPGATVTRILIIPTRRVSTGAAFNDAVMIAGKRQLERLVKNVRGFFGEFRTVDLRDLSVDKINQHLRVHKLTVDDLVTEYCEKPMALR